MNKNQILLVLVLLSLFGTSSIFFDWAGTFQQRNDPIAPKEDKHGEVRQYTKNNRLKTIVNYDNGVKHGTSYLYHDDGKTVLLSMPYVRGKREGISKKYYKNGQLYAETPYKNDKLHGVRKLYYSNGIPKAEIPYAYGLPGIGTKEHFINGKEKPSLSITSRTDGNIVWLGTSAPCKRAIFYIGKLQDGLYFNPIDQNIKSLEDNNENFYVDLEVYTPSYLKYQDIICHCESTQGNPIILKTRLF